jgi:glutamate:Na+ symporter, ESS family
MAFWDQPVVVTSLSLVVLLLLAESLRRVLPGMGRLGLPGSIVAGIFGLVLGPQVVGVVPLDRQVLEILVYHGLAVVFIAIGLEPRERLKGHLASGVRSFAFAIPATMALQAAIGLGLFLVLSGSGDEALHPGVGALLPLAFEEGPGQALSVGAAWEATGLVDGAQVGLVMAALGYAWAVLVGVPLVAWGRRRGLLSPLSSSAEVAGVARQEVPSLPAGALDLLTRQIVAIGGCYALTYLACLGLSTALAGMPDIAATIWGFHFILGAGIAMGVRALLDRLPGGTPLHGPTLSRVSGLTVDVMTCAALAAIQLGVLTASWLPILLITSVGGLATLVACLWLASRAFPDAPFEHAVVWFGMSTGTLPMGLALLRIIDPHLSSPAPVSAVLGSGAAIPLAVPVMLVLLPAAVATFPGSYPGAGLLLLAAAVLYGLALLAVWRRVGSLRFERPWTRLWASNGAGSRPAE